MSHFNKGNPTLYVGNVAFEIPEPDRGGREEDFVKESEIYESLDRVLIEDILGYRLKARYAWGHLSEADFSSLVSAYNENDGLRLRFSGWPKTFPVKVTEFKKGLRDGLKYEDSLEIVLTGSTLLAKYPDIDLMYIAWQNVQSPGLCIIN